jgi:hypothetical protein
VTLGGQQYFEKLLPIFESLCLNEDEETRHKAIEGMKFILSKSAGKMNETKIMSMIGKFFKTG